MKLHHYALVLIPLFLATGCTKEQATELNAAGQKMADGAKDAAGALADFTAEKREELAKKLEQGQKDFAARIEELKSEAEQARGPAKEALDAKLAALREWSSKVPGMLEKLRAKSAANLEELWTNVRDSLAQIPELLKR